ncbi:V-set and immunoglobulin domain-containing protein 1-like [Epinephelus lanceolatus]
MLVSRLQGTALELLSVCFCLLTLTAIVFGHEQGSGDVTVVVKEDSDAVLPCSLSTKENIESYVFDWIKVAQKDGKKKEVFFYDAGIHYNNGRSGQSEEFKGRVFHFPVELQYGNASIIIRKTKVTDSGDYTCVFPRLQTRQTFHIKLVVELIFKDRSRDISGAAPKPVLTIVAVTNFGVQLQCDVRDASPEPKVEWQDSDANSLPAENPQFTERGGNYSVTLNVTKAGCFHCVVKQEEIRHMSEAEICVSEKLFEGMSCKVNVTGGLVGGMILGALTVAIAYGFALWIKTRCSNGAGKQSEENPSEVPLNLQPTALQSS